jgi:hypothetical protein
MKDLEKLVDALTTELERSRDLSGQVVRHVVGTYEIERDAIGPFLVERLSGLEDDEVDLILSPLFTPRLADQALFAQLLGRERLPRTGWPDIVRRLVERPVRARLTIDGGTYVIPLKEVVIERFVYRLRLDGSISETLWGLIENTPRTAEWPLLRAIARRAIFESDERRGILEKYLRVATGKGDYRLADAMELLNLVESYRPAGVEELVERLPKWQQTLQHTIENASRPSPFFNDHAQHQHGGDRDQRGPDTFRIAAKQDELAFLQRLEETLRASTP